MIPSLQPINPVADHSKGCACGVAAPGRAVRAPAARPRIVHMVEAFDQVGGPPKLVRLIIGSPLGEKYQFHVLSYTISGLSPAAILRLRGQLAQLSPDIVHIHGLKADGFHAAVAAKLARARRILVTIHGSTADAIAAYRTPGMRLRRWIVGHILERATLRLADAVYCVCDAMKSDSRIHQEAGTRLRDTIHNGIEVKSAGGHNGRLRKEFGFSHDEIVLIYAGRITRDKGLEVLAAAMHRIMPHDSKSVLDGAVVGHSRVRLLLVGGGEDYDRIRSAFGSLLQTKHVVMTGRRDDMDDLNAMSDIFVLPSFHENLSFALLEAMSAGLPVIATAVGGNPEVVADGLTGRLVPPHDADALAQCILQLSADASLRERMGLAGRERVRNEFSVASMIRKTDEVYRSLLVLAD